jgi:hypothetical protein
MKERLRSAFDNISWTLAAKPCPSSYWLGLLGMSCTADKGGCGSQYKYVDGLVPQVGATASLLVSLFTLYLIPLKHRPLCRAPLISMMEKSAHEDITGGKVSPQLSNDAAYTTEYPAEKAPLMTRLGLTPDSFRRRTLDDKHNQLNKTLKGRHLSMIAIGGSIGAGLFVGSGGALRTGGPASLLIGFGIMGIVSVPYRAIFEDMH